MKKFLLKIIILFACLSAKAQLNYTADSTEKWSQHFQLTVIDQSHNAFKAPYSGDNSLSPAHEEALSITTSLFFGHKLWNNASIYFNPEVSGGSGVSEARGVAGFPNGETFRIGSPAPALYLARLFYRQYIPLSDARELVDADANQLREYVPRTRLVITAGKIALSDIFDNNQYSHDPRSQFMNWALMSNGAWDYPANTRGYIDAVVLEYINPSWALRAAGSLTPTYANGPDFDYNYFKAHGQTIEFTKFTDFDGHKGAIRLLAYRNVTKAPAYRDVINSYNNKTDVSLDVIDGKNYGGVKYGFGLNGDQELNKNLGVFFRAGWNDGKTATWAFTEIDQTLSVGFNCKGTAWHRPDDTFGIAGDINGISKDHRDFLATGGYGFIIGDGKLTNYKAESIFETYYSAKINTNLFVSADYQFVANPAYNADRGPVSFFAIRAHVEF
ncbi:porin [Mucilaginibacter sp. PPCGB 2223]|uniref:carbohydrate porin n=1 Tax=Mucilaginibacter sp. PPCGB 2223 TaxID=1886027 RepID=UPI000824F683|nr:carbohydrate porin [Mucilaginibacter sp. PPCGB 2223]OCX52210.1 porin [Mucilaginibacter sp. PPCGB 2223]